MQTMARSTPGGTGRVSEIAALTSRSCRVFDCQDVEETQSRIAAVMHQPHRLRPIKADPGFRSRMDYLQLPSIGIGSISFGRMALQLEEVMDYHLMIFAARGSARLVPNGEEHTVNARYGVCLGPGDTLNGEFSADCEQLIIRIDGSLMRLVSGRRRPRIEPVIDLALPRFSAWAMLMRTITAEPAMLDLLLRNQHVRADFQSIFLSTLLADARVTDEADRLSVAPASVYRAERYIDAHLSEPITLDDIARAARVPCRTLLDNFRRFRETSPMRYLRERRLALARERLLAGAPDATVLGVLLDCGVGHVGRFAAEYSARYGELPSETLRRRA